MNVHAERPLSPFGGITELATGAVAQRRTMDIGRLKSGQLRFSLTQAI